MNQFYESTRNKDVVVDASTAMLQGLSEDGGLFVLRDLSQSKMDINSLIKKDYYEIAIEVMKKFLFDFTEDEIKQCVYDAYTDKFSKQEVTPLIELQDGYVLELFNGPTSAFKDIGLSILPRLIKTALSKRAIKEDILILTATSGDTGKAALEGFKDVAQTKIIVFYPNHGVSEVQKLQMKTQEGKNTCVCAIEGNFDDAQNGIKEIFIDQSFKKELAQNNLRLSSANSINIGRLIPQMVYYFYAYAQLVEKNKIQLHDKINFVVPTGNFGNILAGYYAKQLGLPVHKLICASNDNNVLFDFLNTGVYNRKRHFLKTISPSMDILISSNLERLLYYVSDHDNAYISKLMSDLNQKGAYQVNGDLLKKLKEDFVAGYATNEETEQTIRDIYEKDHYLLDPHTAVAYKVLLENKDQDHINVVLSTASPYKFTKSVYHSLYSKDDGDEFDMMNTLNEKTHVVIPENLKNLHTKTILHDSLIQKDGIKEFVMQKVKCFK